MSDARPSKDTGYLSLAGVGADVLKERPEDTELGLLRELGKNLVNYLFMSLRTLAIHSEDNAAVELPLERLREILKELNDAVHRTHFITVEGQIYLNDLRIKMEAAAYHNVVYLVGILDKHGIGGITFSRPLERDKLKQLLLLMLNTKPPRGEDADPLRHIRSVLEEADIAGVDFDRPYFFKAAEAHSMAMASGDEAAEQETVALAYAKGILAVKDYFRAVEAAEAANPLRIRKIVHDLVDVAEEDPEDFLKLHTIHGVEDAYYNHCVNVAALSVAIGLQLQLSRIELADLGGAAMFHDVGYSSLERITEEEGREFDESEQKKWHPIAGFKTLLRQGEYGPGLLRRLLVMIEHHMHYRRPGGFPNLGKKRLSVYTRIIQVADHYDALVCPTPDGQPGTLPIRALERIIAGSGTIFDPLVVKTLVNVVGRYPYGSLVTLSSKEVGVVTCGGRDEGSFLSPRVMVVRNADGTECAPREVDLSDDRTLKRRIGSVLDPFTEELTPHSVLFDQLSEGQVDAEQEAAVAPDAWTAAIWAGKNIEDLLREELGDEALELAPTPPESSDEESPSPEPAEAEADQAPPDVPSDEPEPAAAEEPPREATQEPLDSGEAQEEETAAATSAPEPWEAAEAEEAGAAAPASDPEPWEAAEAEETGAVTAGAEPEPWAAAEAKENGTTEPEAEPEPWEAAEAAELAEQSAEATDPESMSEEQIAACKAAHKKAIAEAYSKGGEEAVAAVAARHWSEFAPGSGESS